jgi:hypothetical protein
MLAGLSRFRLSSYPIEHALFEPFEERARAYGQGKRFRERCWPVFWRPRPKPRRRRRIGSVYSARYDRSLWRKLRIEEALKWWCSDALTRQWDRIDDILLDRERGRR